SNPRDLSPGGIAPELRMFISCSPLKVVCGGTPLPRALRAAANQFVLTYDDYDGCLWSLAEAATRRAPRRGGKPAVAGAGAHTKAPAPPPTGVRRAQRKRSAALLPHSEPHRKTQTGPAPREGKGHVKPGTTLL